jgi:hypothetical protein
MSWTAWLFSIFEVGGLLVLLGPYIVRGVRDRQMHPRLYLAIGLLLLFWVESPYCYITYAVYDPGLPRFPDGLGILNKAWGNLPLLTPGGYVAYFMIAAMLGVRSAHWLRTRTTWSWPKCLLVGGWIAGFVWDMIFENLGTSLDFFHYERVAPGLVLFPGTMHQFPVYISLSIATQAMFATYLLGRVDDRGVPVLVAAAGRRMRRLPQAVGGVLATALVLHLVYLSIAAPNVITKKYEMNTTHLNERVYQDLPNQPL